MKKHRLGMTAGVLGVIVLLFVLITTSNTPSVVLGSHSLLLHYSLDEKISKADLIVIGEVRNTLPSNWNSPNGGDLKDASWEDVSRAHGLFTDSLIFVKQILKGDFRNATVRVRSFTGKTEKVEWVNENEPSFVVNKTYLLFLAKDTGATAKVDAGDYVSVGAYQGVYEIVDGLAVSADDELALDELIAYIEKTLTSNTLSPTLSPTPFDLLTETLTTLPLSTETPSPTLTPVELPTETLTETPTETPTP